MKESKILLSSIGSRIAAKIGIVIVFGICKNVYIIIALRMIRLIGFDGTSLILTIYLREMEFNEKYIGLFMTSTFVGDLILSVFCLF